MSDQPGWLTTLTKVREHQLDFARQVLADALRVAKTANDDTELTTKKLSRLTERSLVSTGSSTINITRLQELRRIRDGLRAELSTLRRRLSDAEDTVKRANQAASIRNSELEILVRLSDRYKTVSRQLKRRQEEQILAEYSVTLCNGEASA